MSNIFCLSLDPSGVRLKATLGAQFLGNGSDHFGQTVETFNFGNSDHFYCFRRHK